MNDTTLVLIDGHHLLWRGAYGFPAPVKSRSGEDRTAIFAFFALLRVAQRELPEPSELVVCFDGEFGADRRRSRDSRYKANRLDADTSPVAALPEVKRGLDAHDIAWAEIEVHEGDDLVATLVSANPGRDVIVFSGDRDFFQLLDERVSMFNQGSRRGARWIDAGDVVDRFDVTPEQWCDFRALTGDPADSIPGVRGCGLRTAAELLAEEFRLEDLAQSDRMRGAVGRRIEEMWNEILEWRDLIRLMHDIPMTNPVTGAPSRTLPKPAALLEELDLW